MIYPNDFINQNILGNSIDITPLIPDNTIDLIITSPPYDNMREYEGKIVNNVLYEDNYTFPFIEMAKEMYRILKDGGIAVWVVGDQVQDGGETGNSFRMALKFQEIGFRIYDTMIYHKNGSPFPETARYSQVFEYMFVFLKGKKPNTVNLLIDKPNKWAGSANFGRHSVRKKNGDLQASENFIVKDFGARYNVWQYNTGKNYTTKDNYAFEHPAMFPELLSEDHILTWSKEGDIVLDPMCGAGTTCKMARLNNRNFIGIDINEKYIDISNKRVSGITSYTIDNPNPKTKFIETREQRLGRRSNTRQKKKE